MGFLGFLTKRSGENSKSSGLLKSQAYSAATAGALPIRGTYPVAGNGPNALEMLSKSHRALNETQLSLDKGGAPTSGAPRIHADEIYRPRTAPNGPESLQWQAVGPKQRRRTSTRGAPPVAFRKPRLDPLKSNPYEVARDVVDTVLAEEQFRLHQQRDKEKMASRVSSRDSRSNSLMSETTGRGFKDILDAQSEFKPADFKSRIAATGARDYGEDVAERNMGQNGLDLESPQAQAYYALRPTTGSGTAERSTSSPSRSQHTTRPAFDVSGRSKSLTSSGIAHPQRTSSIMHHMPSLSGHDTPLDSWAMQFPMPGKAGKVRCQSVSCYVPSGVMATQAKSLTGSSSRNARAQAVPHHVPGRGSLESDQDSWDSSSSLEMPPITRTPRTSSLAYGRQSARDSTFLARQKTSSHSRAGRPELSLDHSRFESRRRTKPRTQRPVRAEDNPRSRAHRGSVLTNSTSFASPGQRHSRHTFQSPASSSVASHDTALDVHSMAYPRTSPQPLVVLEDNNRPMRPLSLEDDAALPPPSFASARSASNRESTSPNSAGSTSNASSCPSRRPGSRQTANTSIDPGKPQSSMQASASCPSSPIRTARSSNNFNMDDQILSDDDLFAFDMLRRAQIGEGEEQLLFRDGGYGTLDFQLPGIALFGSSTSEMSCRASQVHAVRHSKSTASQPKVDLRRQGPLIAEPDHRRTATSSTSPCHIAHDNDLCDSESAFSDFEFDERCSAVSDQRRRSSSLGVLEAPSGLGIFPPSHLYPSVSSGIWSFSGTKVGAHERHTRQLDISQAARLRKETKSVVRAAQVAQAASKAKRGRATRGRERSASQEGLSARSKKREEMNDADFADVE